MTIHDNDCRTKQVDTHPEALVLLVAMEKEARQLLPLLGHSPKNSSLSGFPMWESQEGVFAGKCYLLQTGIGKVNAALATSEALRSLNPALLLNIGVSGALSPSVQYLDTIVAKQVAYHDVSCGSDVTFGQVQGLPLYYEASIPFVDAFSNAIPKAKAGLITCGERFMSDIREHNAIRESFSASLAGDMESGAIAQTAFIYKVPFAAVRIISDIPAEGNSYEQYCQFWRTDHKTAFANLRTSLKSILQYTFSRQNPI